MKYNNVLNGKITEYLETTIMIFVLGCMIVLLILLGVELKNRLNTVTIQWVLSPERSIQSDGHKGSCVPEN